MTFSYITMLFFSNGYVDFRGSNHQYRCLSFKPSIQCSVKMDYFWHQETNYLISVEKFKDTTVSIDSTLSIKDNITFVLGDERTFSFWHDKWILDLPLNDSFDKLLLGSHPCLMVLLMTLVHGMVYHENNILHGDELMHLLLTLEKIIICSKRKDKLIWKLSP